MARWPLPLHHGIDGVNSTLLLALLHKLHRRARQVGRPIVLVLDHGSAHTSKHSLAAIRGHRSWLRILLLSKYSSEQFNDIEARCRLLK